MDNLVLDNNSIYNSSGKMLIQWGNKSYSVYDFDMYKSATGKDSNSNLLTLKGIRLEPPRIELGINETQQIKATALYTRNVSIDVTDFAYYTSSNPTVAPIDSKGMIKGMRAGATMIKVTFEGRISKRRVIVQ